MKKSLVTYILIVGIAAIAGTTTGIIGKNLLGQEKVIYKGDPDQYQADSKALLEKYNSNPNGNYSPSDLVNIGLEKYRNCENCYSLGIGVADTVVQQTIRNYQIKNGDQYFEESISKSSMVGVANRAIQDGVDGTIKLYKGSPSSATTATYPNPSDKDKKWSKEEYKKYLGKTLDRMFIFLLSDDTVLKEGTKTQKLDNGNIQVTLNLHPDIAPYYYKIQMKNISGLDALPSFEYLKHTYTFDKDMNLKECYVDEKYKASMGISVTIRNTINYYYYPNEFKEIPSNDTALDYSLKEENA